MKKQFFLFFGVVFILVSLFAFSNLKKRKEELQKIKIGDNLFYVEIANNNENRAKGLSGRDFLQENEGIFFFLMNQIITHFG